MKILYIEDHLAQRDVLKQMLELQGYEVDVAENGKEGISKGCSWFPDVILMDLRMPIIDGIEATMILKSFSDTSNIPIIVISAWGTSILKKKAKDSGADKFFVKPVEFEIILKAISEVTSDNYSKNKPNVKTLEQYIQEKEKDVKDEHYVIKKPYLEMLGRYIQDHKQEKGNKQSELCH